MANKQSKYLHFKVYYKFCLRIKYTCAYFKTNTIQHNKKRTVSMWKGESGRCMKCGRESLFCVDVGAQISKI
jgi:hypothetical protein